MRLNSHHDIYLSENYVTTMFRPRYYRFPSFVTAYCGSVAILLLLVAWSVLDESFSEVLTAVCLKLNRGDVLNFWGITTWHFNGWQELGPRFVSFGILLLLAAGLNSVVAYRIFFGDRESRSLRSMLLGVALCGMWLSLPLSYKDIAETGQRWRVQRILPYLAKDASMLKAKWPRPSPAAAPLGSPTTVSHLPFSGTFVAWSANAPLVKSSRSYPCTFNKQTGNWIWRTDDGGFRFSTLDPEIAVEHHPHGGTPKSFNQTYGSVDARGTLHQTNYKYVLVKYDELEPGWFVVRYSFRFAR
jgi:hypothetical protein